MYIYSCFSVSVRISIFCWFMCVRTDMFICTYTSCAYIQTYTLSVYVLYCRVVYCIVLCVLIYCKVCMYKCTAGYVCMYACIHACMCTYHTHTCIYIYICIYIGLFTQTSVSAYLSAVGLECLSYLTRALNALHSQFLGTKISHPPHPLSLESWNPEP